jgi:hypothetical protein
LLAHIRWFSPGTPASTTNKTGRHDIVEILLKVDIQRLHSKGPHREMNDNINTHMDNTIAGSVNGQQDNDNHHKYKADIISSSSTYNLSSPRTN